MSTVELEATYTKAGLNALWHAKGQGFRDKLTHIALGDTAFTPNANMTTLTGEQDRFAIVDAQEGDLLMRLGVRASTDKEYPVRSVAGFLDDGTMLFAYSSSNEDFLLTYLTPFISGLDIRFLLKLEGIPSNSLSVSVTDPGSLVFTSEFAKIGRALINSFVREQRILADLEAAHENLRILNNKLNLSEM